ncbi:hypothetical protein [Paenibacillus sp.]|uniref:hypothetical protein n=1 Tax=Paenibacillus sp. TaxID=58172 RepID=UPI0028AB9E6D|nr:hypothetical protein [Paenibacillus sp.]
MDRLKKELVFNLCIFSFILSIIYSTLITNINTSLVSTTPYDSNSGQAVVFVLFFLLLFIFHIAISFLNYAVAIFSGRKLVKRIVIFNTIGLILIGVIYFAVKESIVLFLIFSFLIFSVVTLWNNRNSKK